MRGYISGLSAAKIWNIPCLETVVGNEITEPDSIDITGTDSSGITEPDSITGSGGIKGPGGITGTDGTGIPGPDSIPEPDGTDITEPYSTNFTDITVLNHNARFRINGKKVRSTELALPSGAIKTVDGKKVASPELVFLDLACKLSIHRLILLGLQLCSHKQGLPSRAITTKQKLVRLLEKTAWHRGHRKAIRAVKYVENGSASIIESLTYMILCLPYALGGYGLSGAVFNYEIKLTNDAFVRLDQDCFFVDLYYKQAKLGVEYDSFAHHSSPSEQGKDAVRAAILKRQGIETLHMRTIQLYDRNACKDFAYNLASHLGKRIHIRTKKFDEMHTLIRSLLPEGKPAQEP